MSKTLLRWLIVLSAAVLCAAYSLWYNATGGADVRPDFDQWWGAARALLAGLDPYVAVGPGQWFHWEWPFYYPLTAAVAALPFAAVDLIAARAAFAALCGGVFAMALTRGNDFSRAPALLSMSFLIAIQYGQLSPLFAAALVYPWLGGLAAVKPTVGLAVLAAQRGRAGVYAMLIGVTALTLAAFILDPRWPLSWYASTRGAEHLATRWAGAVLLLAWLWWRRPEARWLGTIALAPMTSPLIESLPLFMAPLTFRQSLTLALLTHAARWLAIVTRDMSDPFAVRAALDATITIGVVYLPALWWITRASRSSATRT